MSVNIEFDGKVYAVLIPASYKKEGVEFFTPDDYSQQLAYISHKENTDIKPHVHQVVERSVSLTHEVLIIRKGKLRVDFYSDNQEYISSLIIEEGDVILLTSGGHGFKVIEKVEMIEVKQGPYLGERDKIRFQGIEDSQVKYMGLV